MVEPDLRAFNYERFYAERQADRLRVVAARPARCRSWAIAASSSCCAPSTGSSRRGARRPTTAATDDDADVPAGDHDALETYLTDPSRQTVLVFVASDVNRSCARPRR